MEPEKTQNRQDNPEGREQSRRHSPPRLQAVLQSYSHQMAWCWHKKSHRDYWNRRENPEINPYTYSQLIFNKGGRRMQWGKDKLFSKWESWTTVCKSMKLEYYHTTHKNILKMT